MHSQSAIEILVVAKVNIAGEFPSNCIIYWIFDLNCVWKWGSVIEVSLGFGEVHKMVTSFGKVYRIIANLVTNSSVIVSQNGCKDRNFLDLFELEAGKGIIAEIGRNLLILESSMLLQVLVSQFIDKLCLGVPGSQQPFLFFNLISGHV